MKCLHWESMDFPLNKLSYKLKNLRDLLPSMEEIVYQFADLLASNIVTDMSPNNFIAYYTHWISDLKNWKNWYGICEISGLILNYSDEEYDNLINYFTQIVKVVFNESFANETLLIKQKIDNIVIEDNS